jgi:hypothetical protein
MLLRKPVTLSDTTLTRLLRTENIGEPPVVLDTSAVWMDPDTAGARDA